MRFAGAKQQGLTEDHVDSIADGYQQSELSQRHKLVIAYVDLVLANPSQEMDADLKAQLLEHFSAAELEELTLTAGIACGFSKAAIAWGPPPEMPLAELPTPTPDSTLV